MIETVKLSELKDDMMLIVDGLHTMTKREFVEKIWIYNGEDVYSTIKYDARLDAREILYYGIEQKAQDMYDDWEDDIWNDVTRDDIKEIQSVLNRILNRNKNVSYIVDKKVEVDYLLD